MIKYSWIKDNITSLIALGFTFMYFVLKIIILMADLTVSREILTQTNTGLDTMEVMILGYYVGSSKKPLPDTKNDVTVSGDLNVKGPTDAQ